MKNRYWSISFFRLWLIFFFLHFIISTAFIILVPIFGGPDEPFHTYYSYTLYSGQFPQTDWNVQVPAYMAPQYQDCWAFKSEVPSTCQPPLSNDTHLAEVILSGVNYPPLYYILVGWPLLFLKGASAIWVMRFLTIAIFSALSALGIAALIAGIKEISSQYNSQQIRLYPSHILGILILITLFTPSYYVNAGFINPSALEISLGVAMAGFLIPVIIPEKLPKSNALGKKFFLTSKDFTDANSLRVKTINKRFLYAGICCFFLILSRPPAPLWAFLFSLIILIAGGLRLLRYRGAWIFISLATISCLIWLLFIIYAGSVGPERPVGDNNGAYSMAIEILRNYIRFAVQVVGITGWHDSPVSQKITFVFMLYVLTALIYSLTRTSTREKISIILGMILIPASAIGINTAVAGEINSPMWQMRYAFPYIFPLLMLCGWFIVRNVHISTTKINQPYRSPSLVTLSFIGLFTAILTFFDFYKITSIRMAIGIFQGDYFDIIGKAPATTYISALLLFITGVAIVAVYIRAIKKLPLSRLLHRETQAS